MTTKKIEWTDETWNPVTGCTPMSKGCANCYAERMARRLAGRHGYPPAPHHFDVTMRPNRLNEPLRWKRPRRVFVCSMGDLFHENVPLWFIDRIFEVMDIAKSHTFQVLTKRPARLLEYIRWWEDMENCSFDLPNVWLGVTAENQAAADERIPTLLQVPAAVRFVSYEPALGRVDFSQYLKCQQYAVETTHKGHDVRVARLHPCLDWVIAGGETGPRARPMHPQWVRNVRDQCVEAGVPFFFKGWGEYIHESQNRIISLPAHLWDDGTMSSRVGKKAAGYLLDGQEWRQFPNV